MHSIPVALPTAGGNTPATLYYEQDYNLLGGHPLSFLHIIRQPHLILNIHNPHGLEESLWDSLNATRKAFAAAVVAVLLAVDMIVEAHSHRFYQKPFTSAFKQVYNVPCLLLNKSGAARPAYPISSRGFTPHGLGVPVADRHRILIVDDVFAEGKSAARVVEFLRNPGLPNDVEFHIAALLQVPPPVQNANAANNIGVTDLPPPDDGGDEASGV
jgi:hypothetical protein